MKPLISVVIPTYNRPDQLIRAVGSVLSQTYKAIELIVVDDGSTINMADLLRSSFPASVIWLRHETPVGASQARNAGLRIAQGEYVAFLDDDDRWLPHKLACQLASFQRFGEAITLVGCGHAFEIDGREVKTRVPVCPAESFEQFLQGNWLGGTSMPLIRRDKLLAVGGFDGSLPSCQDWDLWLRLCRNGGAVVVPEILVIRSIHEGQMTTDIRRKIAGRQRLLEKYRSELETHPRFLARQRQRLGTLSLLAGERFAARGHYRSAINVRSADWISWLGMLLSLLPSGIGRILLEQVAVERIGKYRLYH